MLFGPEFGMICFLLSKFPMRTENVNRFIFEGNCQVHLAIACIDVKNVKNVKNVQNVQNVNSCDWRRCIRMLLWASLGFSMTAPCCWRDALLKSPGC